MKQLFLILFFIPLSILPIFGQTPPVKPAQVGTGSSADAGKVLLMDANGRGVLGAASGSVDSAGYSYLTRTKANQFYWQVGGNTVSAHSIIGTNSAYDLIFRTNSTEQMRILSNGNIGIGTSSPSVKLNVSGKTVLNSGTATGNTVYIDGSGSTGADNSTGLTVVSNALNSAIQATGSYSSFINPRTYATYGTGAQWSGVLNITSDNATTAYGHVMFFGNTVNLRVKMGLTTHGAAGKFFYFNTLDGTTGYGMPTVFQASKTGFNVLAVSDITAGLTTRSYNDGVIAGNTSASNCLDAYNSSSTLLFRVRDDGNIGIGTTSPAKKLHVNGDVRIATLPSGASADSLITANATGDLQKRTVADVTGWTTSTTNQYSARSGNVGIGTSAPAYKLDIANQTRVGAQGGSDVTIIEGGSGYGSQIKQYTAAAVLQNHFSANGNSFLLGNVGIGTTTPSVKLDVSGTTKTTNLQITSGAVSGYLLQSDASGNTAWTNTISDARLSTNVALKNEANTWAETQEFQSDVTFDGVIRNVSGDFLSPDGSRIALKLQNSNNINYGGMLWYNAAGSALRGAFTDAGDFSVNGAATISGVAIAANATAATHLVNRQTGDTRYGQLTAANAWYGLNSFGASNTVAAIVLGSTKIYASSNINSTTDNNADNGDLILDKNTGQLAMKVNYQRRNIRFENNFQQNHNIAITDGADTSAVTLSDSTRTVRIYKGSAVTTSKVKVTLPQYPTSTTRLTVLVETDPTSITFFSPTPAAQAILTASNFPTVVVGDVIELWFAFADGTGNSNTGKWYIKKL